MKRIVFVLPTLNIGGIERVTLDIIEFLKNFYEIHLIVLNDDGSGFICPKEIKFHNLEIKRARYALLDLKKILDNFEDCIIISPVSYITVLLSFLKNRKKIKIISIEHGLVSYRMKDINSFLYRKFYEFLLRKSLKSVDGFVFVSEATRNDWVKFFNLNFHDSKVIYNKINFTEIDEKMSNMDEDTKLYLKKITNNKKVIMSVSRLSKEKNLILACQSFVELKKKLPNSVYIILGDGDQRENIQNWINENQMQDSIFLIGFQKNPYYFLSIAHLLLLTSHHEALPTVVIEALYMNKYVVSVNCPGGINEICHNLENAKVLSQYCPKEISLAMKYFLENQNFYDSKEIIIKKFGTDIILEKYINVIEMTNV